jgi:hypothetical protein
MSKKSFHLSLESTETEKKKADYVRKEGLDLHGCGKDTLPGGLNQWDM